MYHVSLILVLLSEVPLLPPTPKTTDGQVREDFVVSIEYTDHRTELGFYDTHYIIFWDYYWVSDKDWKVEKKIGVVDIIEQAYVQGKPIVVDNHFELMVGKGKVSAKYYIKSETYESRGEQPMYDTAFEHTPPEKRRELFNPHPMVYIGK